MCRDHGCIREAEASPDDTSYGDQWSLPKIGWDNVFGTVTPTGSAVVAVLDTGVNSLHNDLSGRVVQNVRLVDTQSVAPTFVFPAPLENVPNTHFRLNP